MHAQMKNLLVTLAPTVLLMVTVSRTHALEIKPGLVLRVASDGADTHDGTAAAPFRTLERAQAAVREVKKAKAGLPQGGILVQIAQGNYPVERSLSFGPEDSGEVDRPVVYAGSGVATVLSGGADANNPALTVPMIILGNTSFLVIRDLMMENGGGNAINTSVAWADTTKTSTVNQRNVVLDRLTIRHFRGNGISIRGFENVIRNCHLHDLGAKGVNLGGGDVETLTPANNLLFNTRIEATSKLSKGNGWGVSVDVAGIGQILRNNLITDGRVPRVPEGRKDHLASICVRGAEHLIERNEFRKPFTGKADDCGAIYFNHSSNPHMRGTVIRHNFFNNIGESSGRQSGVYVDWCTQDVLIEGNIFYRIGGPDQKAYWKAGVMNNAGNYVRTVNNLFIDCSIPYRMSYWVSTWGGGVYGENVKKLLDRREAVFSQTGFLDSAYIKEYPELLVLRDRSPEEAWLYPAENTFERNLVYNPVIPVREEWTDAERGFRLVNFTLKPLPPDAPENTLIESPVGDIAGRHPDTLWEGRMKDNWYATEDPGFVNLGAGDLSLKEDAELFRRIPGFDPIPFENIGLIKSKGTTYTSWQGDVFNSEEQADPSISGEQASPAGDGISNLMKYAMKLDPKSSGVANLPRSSARDGHLTFTYRRNKLASDLTYTVQVTSDLTSAEWQDAGVVISQTDEGEYWVVTVRDDQPMHNHSKRFMRLKVSYLGSASSQQESSSLLR